MLSRHFDFTTLSNFKGKTHLLSKLVNFWVWEPQRVFFLLVAEIMKVKFWYEATPKIWGPVDRPRKSHFSSLPGYQRDTSDSEQYRMTYLSMTSRVRSSMDLVLSITRAAIQACFSSPLSAWDIIVIILFILINVRMMIIIIIGNHLEYDSLLVALAKLKTPSDPFLVLPVPDVY